MTCPLGSVAISTFYIKTLQTKFYKELEYLFFNGFVSDFINLNCDKSYGHLKQKLKKIRVGILGLPKITYSHINNKNLTLIITKISSKSQFLYKQ
jgi:hypothetical protein